MKIEYEILDELFSCSNPSYEIEGWRYVSDWRDSDSRWESHHYIIITKDGQEFWEGHVTQGLTEYQEGRDHPELVELRQVYPHKVEIIEYKRTP